MNMVNCQSFLDEFLWIRGLIQNPQKCVHVEDFYVYTSYGVSTIPGLWTGLDRGLDSGLDRGLTAIQTLIYRFHYNITV